MNREEKSAVVDELAERLGEADAIFAVDYRGISVPQAAELRAKLRESDATFKVVKNRLAKRAAEQAGTEGLDELFTGPVALTLISGDAALAAKAINTFTREHEVLEYKGGFMDGAPLDPDSFRAIAKLPGRDVLHGQLVGIAASPLTGLVAGMGNLISGLGRQLAQMAEQGLVGGDAPAQETEPPSEVEEAEEAKADRTEADPGEEPAEPEAQEPADEEVEEPEAAEEPEAEAEAAEAEETDSDEDNQED